MNRFISLFVLGQLVLTNGVLAETAEIQTQTQIQTQAQNEKTQESELLAGTTLKPPKVLIPFALQASQGQPFTHESLVGHWSLLFFGYTQCPDVCPTTLAQVTQLWNSFPNNIPHPKSQFVFVSLNPSYDSPDKLKEFLSRFNPTFIGVTGDEATIKALSKSMSIYSWEDPKLNAAGQKVIDHSGTLLLINPEGQLCALFSPPHDIQKIKQDLQVIQR